MTLKFSAQVNQVGWTQSFLTSLGTIDSAHNVKPSNNNKWQYIVELFEEDLLM